MSEKFVVEVDFFIVQILPSIHEHIHSEMLRRGIKSYLPPSISASHFSIG